MQTKNIKLIPIGNSRGVRIPKVLIQKYGLQDTLIMEETERGILLRKKEEEEKLSWEDTFREMAKENEDWSDFDVTLSDGLKDEPDA